MSQDKPKKLTLKNIQHLPDAITNGKLMCGLQSILVIERIRSTRSHYCECIVKQISDTGIVTLWDDTLEQWYVIELHNPPPFVKILNNITTEK